METVIARGKARSNPGAGGRTSPPAFGFPLRLRRGERGGEVRGRMAARGQSRRAEGVEQIGNLLHAGGGEICPRSNPIRMDSAIRGYNLTKLHSRFA